eukprot:TRINITY_DN6338_c0_g1_i2.p1 TRINITY_DN6338_c0_g1~~TRINITY_DN6338_c0_g1_i2.p1  ORF type:complete len:465 (+),score=100.63 TRINITY_DN6338_c0_g1_i2:240-1634(+)
MYSIRLNEGDEGNVPRASTGRGEWVLYGAVAVSVVTLLIIIFVEILVFPGSVPTPSSSSPGSPSKGDVFNVVVLASFDGLAHRYLEGREELTAFNKLATDGCLSEMQPIFPSKTFPNHYSIATGLYSESHGIVGNDFWNPTFQEEFTLRNGAATEGKWWGGEPIWNTVQRMGLQSASFFWPGSEANISGTYPTYYRKYDSSVPYDTRVDQVVEWASMPDESQRPSLISVYFDLVDSTGHSKGPDNKEAIEAVVLDANVVLERLIDGLQALESDESNNVQPHLVVVSDHGMAATSPSRILYIVDLIDEDFEGELDIIYGGALAWINVTAPDDVPALVHQLEKSPHMTVLLKDDMPERYHYTHNDRIPSIVLLADDGYRIGWSKEHPIINPSTRGDHGFDPWVDTNMTAIFGALSPRIKVGSTLDKFENVHVYSLMCELLGIDQTDRAPTNGTTNTFKSVLKKNKD